MSSSASSDRDPAHTHHRSRRVRHAARASAIVDDVRRIIRVLRQAERQAETDLGVSGAQLFVLQKLSDGPAASLNELAGRTLTHQSSVSVVVRRLVERGLVSRDRSAEDGRRIELRLTRAGERIVRRAPTAPQMRLVDAVRALDDRDLRTLGRLMHRIATAMGAGRLAPAMIFTDRDT